MIRWQSVPTLESSWLVRYRFHGPDQLQRHLRFQNGGPGFLFLGDKSLPFATGSRVVLEVDFAHTGQRSLLHGSVRSRERDGLWLELPLARAALVWIRKPDAPRRRSRRFAADLFADLRIPGQPASLCRVTDVSATGVRISCGSLYGLLPNEQVSLTLLPADLGVPSVELTARVAWAGQREVGLEALSPPPGLAELVSRVESRWEGADEVAHPDECRCAHGEPSDPWPYWIAR